MLVTAANWQTLSESTIQQVSGLKKEVEDLNGSFSSLQEKAAQLNRSKDILNIMERMEADLAAIQELRLIRVVIASVPHKNVEGLKTALANFPLLLRTRFLSKDTDFVFIALPSKQGTDIDKILKTHHAEIFAIPEGLPHSLVEALKEVNSQLEDNSNDQKKLVASLNKLSRENFGKFASWKETTENILALLNAEKKILQSGMLATVEGFVPTDKFSQLNEKIHSMLGDKAIVLKNEPVEPDDPPTKLSNNRFVAPFEELTKLYGLPHYNELDPTPLMAITFPIIFGLMFGDIGHGLILLVGGLTLWFLIKKGQAIRNVCWIMATCGIGAIVAGALYGEFFGKELFAPLWFSPFNNVFDFLIFSLVVGVIQITSGLALEMANWLINRNFVDAVFTSIPKLAFYIGAVYVIVDYKLNLAAWFSGPILLIIVPFVLMVFAKPTFVAFSKLYALAVEAPSGQDSVGQRLFESGDMVTRLLSNSISYTRILALLMAHWALILVTYTVAGLVAGSGSAFGLVLSGIVIVGGNLFVIALEGLIVFIHTLRLHFYEWFSKFYQGTGTPFNPFKQHFVYTKVDLQKKA